MADLGTAHPIGRDLAFAEAAHRCANDLGLVSGILHRARTGVADVSARAALDDAAACVDTIVLVHRAIEPHPGSDGTVDLGRYLPQLTNRLRQAYLAHHQVGCRLDVDPGRVSPEVARTLGLIVCELTRNAAKHAFSNGHGVVTVALRAKSPPWRLTVRDNGAGMPVERAPLKRSGQGLALVQALAKSIGGALAIDGDRGTTAEVRFPEPGAREPSAETATPKSYAAPGAGR